MITFLNACGYEQSAWNTDPHCPNMLIEDNLKLLKHIELRAYNETDFTFAIIGDPQQYPEDFQRTIEAINEDPQVSFIMLLGDLAETGVAQEFEWTCKAAAKATKPILAVAGNHDALSFGKDIWLKNFGEYDYSFSFLNTQFIAFNNNRYEFPDAPDLPWILDEAKQAKDNKRHHIFGLTHIKPWPDQQQLEQDLKNGGFDHMFYAHDNRFEYWQTASTQLPHLITSDSFDINYSKVKVTPTDITVTMCRPQCFEPILEIRDK